MKESENIWGKEGCELPSGELCDACCYVKRIESRWGRTKHFSKEELTPCPFMARVEGGGGCKVHEVAPNGCEAYHCSEETPQVKLILIAYALQEGMVTENDAAEAIRRATE